MSEFVVWFDSAETGAPILNNAPGSLIGVLDACLVTGFNPKTLTSLSVAGGLATATLNAHGYSADFSKDVLIAGATPALLNGRKQLTAVTPNTFTFAAPGVPDGAASGTITTKRDPLGWTKQFTATNKALYKRSDPRATTLMLRVVDDNAAPGNAFDARVQMVESATSIDLFTQPSPNASVITDGLGYFWNKGANTAAAKQWSLVGDSRGFYLFTQSGTRVLPSTSVNDHTSSAQVFSDFASLKQGDAYNTILAGRPATTSGDGNVVLSGTPTIGGGFGAVPAAGDTRYLSVARTHAQLPGPVSLAPLQPLAGSVASGNVPNMPFPSPIDNGFVMAASVALTEAAAGGFAVRGFIPGHLYFLSSFPLQHLQIIGGVAALPGRQIIGVRSHCTYPCNFGLDLTGPWF